MATTLDDHRPVEVQIKRNFDLNDSNPIYHSARIMAHMHNGIVRKKFDKRRDEGIITLFSSAWSFPIVVVPKKDGNPRFCVEYRSLNQRTKAEPMAIDEG